MNKAIIIIPYFGKAPNYLPFFLKSCESNANVIDILLPTDLKFDKPLPTNVIKHEMYLSDFNTLASSKTGITFNIQNPYKLCDVKPLYGHIFCEYIKDYEFWGYGDLDIIYGDLSKFINFQNLRKYDVITFREYIISGALTLLRNNNYTRKLYLKSPDISKVIESSKYERFDEAGKKIGMCRKRIPAYELIDFDNLTCWSSIIHREFHEDRLNLYSKYEIKESIPFNSILEINYDEVKMGMDEFVAYHLVTEKKYFNFKIPDWSEIPKKYFVSNTGFYKSLGINFLILHNYRKILFNANKFVNRVKDSLIYRLKLKK